MSIKETAGLGLLGRASPLTGLNAPPLGLIERAFNILISPVGPNLEPEMAYKMVAAADEQTLKDIITAGGRPLPQQPLPPVQSTRSTRSSVSDREKERFRSFAERYVVERARGYTGDAPMRESWYAALDAKKLYKHINAIANSLTQGDLP